MSIYYTDREFGVRPPSVDTIEDRLWAVLYTLVQTRIGDGSLTLPAREARPKSDTRGHDTATGRLDLLPCSRAG
jgi:hypothetical protein